MPGSTPIYGFPYPDPSDLVANYPALGQQLAEDIEDVLPTLGGLTLITSNTFSAVASVSLNNCFTATYANYRVVLNTLGTGGAVRFRLRVGGADASGASTYRYQHLEAYASTVASTESSFAYAELGYQDSTKQNSSLLDLFNPQLTQTTGFLVHGGRFGDVMISAGDHNVATSYDGISIFPGTGTFTGTVRVYGYKNS
jgi:hypothetical protein